jgi:hypothetical protein
VNDAQQKALLPGVFVFSEEKPPYIARLLYETVTGLFHFCRLCRTIIGKQRRIKRWQEKRS